MYSLARKNHLGRNLMRMRKNFPEHFKFFPPTWLLPAEYSDFRAQFSKKLSKTFIIKPEASCQGRGIFLTRNYEDVDPTDHYVAQRYIHKPYLIDGLKFDCRIYVLLAGTDPLRIYLFNDGLGRFATEAYVNPKKDNLDDVCMHLTNYAINKDNPNFVFNENEEKDAVGHKRSFISVLNVDHSITFFLIFCYFFCFFFLLYNHNLRGFFYFLKDFERTRRGYREINARDQRNDHKNVLFSPAGPFTQLQIMPARFFL